MPMNPQVPDKTKFLNVALCIFSKSDLTPLVAAMGKRVEVYYTGREGRAHKARLALPWRSRRSPESQILGFCKLIRELSPEARELWNAAKTRTLDIGIEAPGPKSCYWSSISPKALKAASEINAQIAVTVYGPMKRAKLPSKSRKAAASK
jgi:hypothetical protein